MTLHPALHLLTGAAFVAWGIALWRGHNAPAHGDDAVVAVSANRTRRLLAPPLIVLGALQFVVALIRLLFS